MVTTDRSGLTVALPSDREIVMTRTFDAPRRLVFDVWTKPEHLVHWYGRKGWTLQVCEVDLRPGGGWRFVMVRTDGAKMEQRGVYREVVRPERLVFTERFEGEEFERMGGETLKTLLLSERDGRTTVTQTIRYASPQGRDAALRTPMEEGTASAFERLDEHLRTMAAGEVAERYQRLAAAFADKLANVPADRWDAPTPCPGWDVRDLVRHVVDVNAVHLRLAGHELPAGPGVDDDPLGAFDRVRGPIIDDLTDPARAQAPITNRFGTWAFAEIIDRAVCVDLAIHGWDLARATGQDERIDPAVLPYLWAAVNAVGEDVLRNPIAYGPALDPPPDADEQTRLLAHLGRQAWPDQPGRPG